MKLRVMVTAFAIGFAVLAAPQTDAGDDEKNVVTICTYNVNWGNPDLVKTAALIKAIDADFVALQETNARSQAFLVKHLKTVYPHMTFTKYSGRGAGGFGFLSKHAIKGALFEKPKHGSFGAYRCKISIGDRTISILSTHLTPILPRNDATATEVAKLMYDTETTRTKEIKHLVKGKPSTPTIVLGDFNSASHQFSPRYLKQLSYTDSFAAVNKAPDKQVTWRWVYKGVQLKYRIDYLFHSPHFKTLESSVKAKGPSDHYPVVSKLTLLPPN